MGSDGSRYCPLSFVGNFRACPVWVLVIVTVEPGMAAPWESETTPKTAAVSRLWVNEPVVNTTSKAIDLRIVRKGLLSRRSQFIINRESVSARWQTSPHGAPDLFRPGLCYLEQVGSHRSGITPAVGRTASERCSAADAFRSLWKSLNGGAFKGPFGTSTYQGFR